MARYFNKDALLPHTEEVSEIGKLFAEKYKDKDIDSVCGPAIGGIILAQWTAFHLSKLKGKEVLAVFTEKTPDRDQIFTRGNEQYVTGKKVLVVEDTATTGGSLMKVVRSIERAGGTVVNVCIMINKDPKNINSEVLGIEVDSLSVFDVETWEPSECPLCKGGVPVTTIVGHGKKFLEGKM